MGNWIATRISTLLHDILERFSRNQDFRNDPKHPENIVIVVKSSEQQKVNESPIVSTTNNVCDIKPDPSVHFSDLYLACRGNDVKTVEKLLTVLDYPDINRVESNGSTALHTACYHGYHEIVAMLLEAGADRTIRNRYDNLPFHEAKTQEIKELFFRTPGNNRLFANSGEIEWQLFDTEIHDKVREFRSTIKHVYETVERQKMYSRIQRNYIETSLKNFEGIPSIRASFQRASDNDDPREIIKAYTAETELYKVINKELATGANTCESERKYIIALIYHHPILEKYSFTGISYRVMQVTETELGRYAKGNFFMNKTFVSSSVQENIVALFLYRQIRAEEKLTRKRLTIDGKQMKRWVLCTYKIKHARSALAVHTFSQYVMEEEVLIMPYTVFKVTHKTEEHRSELVSEQYYNITFEECDSYL